MEWDYELTEKDYQRALVNGIDRDRVRERVYNLGWDKERAVTEPINKKVDRSHWLQIAAEHGVTRSAFNTRLQRGWSEEKAATTPKLSIAVAHERRHELQRKYPVELLHKAVENGISEQTFRRRVREGWSPEIAATKPNFSRKSKKELIAK
ncbi:nucleoside permease [Paenibacillus illinoisensis]|uniref:nucleoside permease n=1 Tax=Paenibacillus illinoisensis TaxID=59845 RepID=UPI00301CAB9E